MQVVPDHVSSVRLILRQPSSVWLSFTLEEISIHPQSTSVSPLTFQRGRETGRDMSDLIHILTCFISDHLLIICVFIGGGTAIPAFTNSI